MKKFWNWVKNEQGERTLLLESVIAEESWYGDEVTPTAFRQELFAEDGPITLSINSPGGDTIAASQIYTMLMEYPYDVTVKITGIAASAASVIAMAGSTVTMSPTSMMMVHNPFTIAMGDSAEMRRASQLLDEVKESIINAYELKTGMSRTRLSHMMNDETWMNAVKAKELGFCDEILFTDDKPVAEDAQFFATGSYFARKAVMNCLLDKIRAEMPAADPTPLDPEPETRIPAASLMDRLARLKHTY